MNQRERPFSKRLQLLSGHIYVTEYRKSTEKIINRVQQDETDYPQETPSFTYSEN